MECVWQMTATVLVLIKLCFGLGEIVKQLKSIKKNFNVYNLALAADNRQINTTDIETVI